MNDLTQMVKDMIEDNYILPVTFLSRPDLCQIIKDSEHYEIPDMEQLKEAIEYLEIEEDTLYLSRNPISPFVYHRGFTYVDLQTLHKDYLILANMKHKIESHEWRMDDFLEAGQYVQFIDNTDKKFALHVFHELYEEIPREQKYRVFRALYIRLEYGFNTINPEILADVLTLNRDTSFKDKLETDEDGFIRVYRGQGGKSMGVEQAYSWTTNLNVAKFFANRFDKGKTYQGKVHINHVIDYIEDRNEFEILTHPKNVVMIEELKQV